MKLSGKVIPLIMLAAVICLSIFVLSFVYAFTEAPADTAANRIAFADLHRVIDAYDFVSIRPDTVWQAVDSTKNPVGIVFRLFPKGYAGKIPVTAGIDLAGIITGITIAGQGEILKETRGLGSRILEPWFAEQFKGKSEYQVKLKKDGGDIDAITGATVSSRAVCNGINKGTAAFKCFLADTTKKGFISKVLPDAGQTIDIIKDTAWYALRGCDTLGIAFVGFCFGYLDTISFLVGVGRDSNITGIEIQQSQETEGMGELIRESEFLDKFKQGKPEAITGATISSSAVIKAVDEAMKRFIVYIK
ncbi:MAG TPA: FMN-binding protein [bacterium]